MKIHAGRDQILLIVSPCVAHVWMTAGLICHICSNLIEVDREEESQASAFSSGVQLLPF